jgi:hypothetical protein
MLIVNVETDIVFNNGLSDLRKYFNRGLVSVAFKFSLFLIICEIDDEVLGWSNILFLSFM